MTSQAKAQCERIKPSYRKAIEFIAHNDEPDEMDEATVATLLSVIAVSVAFGVSERKVARAVIRLRRKEVNA